MSSGKKNPRSKTMWLLAGSVVFQFVVLTGMVGVSAMPLWTGEEIRVRTIPVDPRSLFRGNYARLRYSFHSFDVESGQDETIKRGSVVYVSLQPASEGDFYEYADWSKEKPDGEKFLRARVTRYWCSSDRCKMQVKYGIEAIFAAREKALTLEQELRDGGIAVLMVSKSGKARIKEVRGLSPES